MTRAVHRTIHIDQPPERVWQAVVDPALIQNWFSPGTPWQRTELAPGGRLFAVGYESMAAVIEAVEAPSTFCFRWDAPAPAPQLTTRSTYRLQADGGGTRLTFTETIEGDLSPEAHEQRVAATEDGYAHAFENLKAWLEGRALPHPEGL